MQENRSRRAPSPERRTAPPPASLKKNARSNLQASTGCVLVILVMLAGIFYVTLSGGFLDSIALNLATMADAPVSADTTPVTFSINEGDTAASIADRLEAQHLIRSALLFRIQARMKGIEGKLEAGDYKLNRSMTTAEILDHLQNGRRASPLVTIPEGWRAAQIADKLDQMGLVKREDFMAALSPSNYSYSFLKDLPPDANVEGYLFPNSYQISSKMTAHDVVDLMLKTFDKSVPADLRNQPAPQNLTLNQVLTLASIVEREARVPSERPIIASVYLNRLALGMPLQADPTVQYALTLAVPESIAQNGYWKSALTNSDLGVSSPYNTYRTKGLPPGPICNPGLDTIKAVLAPAHTDYLYFVAKPDGSHAFARTLEEHNENVQKYLK